MLIGMIISERLTVIHTNRSVDGMLFFFVNRHFGLAKGPIFNILWEVDMGGHIFTSKFMFQLLKLKTMASSI